MNKIHVYDIVNGALLAEFPSELKAIQAADSGAIPGIQLGGKYIIVEVKKVLTPRLDYIDLTEETLNRTPTKTPESKPVGTRVESKEDETVEIPKDMEFDGSSENQTKLEGSSTFDEALAPTFVDFNQGIDLGE